MRLDAKKMIALGMLNRRFSLSDLFRMGNDGFIFGAHDPAVLLTRRNLLLATATMSTQSVTTRPVAHTLSFTGTGTVTLTGASTAGPLVGTGASDRVSLSFTPTAASLTMTVAGSVTLAQLERGSLTEYQAVLASWDTTYLADSRHDRVVQWQESTGVTPITVTETARGLALDERYTGIQGADTKSTGVVGLVGAATVATYNTGTGVGSASRAADASNQSYVTFAVTAGRMYRFRLAVGAGTGNLNIRDTPGGAIYATQTIGFDGYVHVVPTGSTIVMAVAGNSQTVNFTITSFKEVPGNHTLQATAAARPVVSQLVNLLLSTGTFAGASWTKRGAAAVGVAAPDGTGELLSGIGAGGVDDIYQAHLLATGVVSTPRILLWPVSVSGTLRIFNPYSEALGGYWSINMALLTPGQWNVISSAHPAVTVGVAFSGYGGGAGIGMYASAGAPLSFYAKQPDSRTADDAAKQIPAYQYVNTATDYDTVGFPAYERFDGVDDNRTCASGGGSTTGFFWCGVVTVLGGAGATRTLFDDRGTNAGVILRISTGNSLSLILGNGTTFAGVFTANDTTVVGSTYVLAAWYEGGVGYVQINNQTPVASAAITLSAGVAGFTEGKSHTAASEYHNGRLYGRVMTKNYCPSASQRELIKRELARQACATHLLT